MSDPSSPPKPKPGSLRDRIAAFENKGAAASPPGPTPPQPRPKPGGIQWKPKPPSPPTSPDPTHSQTSSNIAAASAASGGGMSASDAMESIVRGGSLKERMAALQGKGAFAGSGGPPPPIAPKPVERPKWKPPPAVAVPADEEEHGASHDAERREASRSPPPRAAVVSPRAVVPVPGLASENEGDGATQANEGGENDPEEEERQRRAAIAARMARLGGARLGMGPPIFAPKPVVRKAEPPSLAPEAKEEVAPAEAFDAQLPPHELVSDTLPDSESERKEELESAPAVPTRAPTSMPVPAGPRRAAPPRKKVSKPTPPLPELPPAESESSPAQPISDEPLATTNREIDVSVVAGDAQKEIDVVEEVLARPLPPAPTEEFHEPAEEPEREEAEEEPVEGGSHADEGSMHTAIDEEHEHEQEHEQQEEAAEEEEPEEEDEEARRKRVAARLAQMGAFNPLAGPPPIPSREPLEEQATSEEHLEVEDEVNVDTEEYGETIPPPPAILPRQDSVEFIEHHAYEVAHAHEAEAEAKQEAEVAEPHAEIEEDAKVKEEEDRVPIHRDGESQNDDEENGHGHQIELHERGDGHTLPESEGDERRGDQEPSDSVIVEDVQRFERDQRPCPHDIHHSATDPVSTGERDDRKSEIDSEREGVIIASSTGYTAERLEVEEKRTEEHRDDNEEHHHEEDEENEEDMAPPRITRPIPPLPVNLGSRPTPPTSPHAKTPVQALRATGDDEERPASPDMPPRPVPPPVRSVPPPIRRTSVRVTDVLGNAPSTPPPPPPPVPISPRQNRRPITPPIITAITVQEQESSTEEPDEERVSEEEPTETSTPQPEATEDEASTRRRAIAERMARLGGIRFGAPPAMNPLVRPPLPAAPPPTSIPPDETESEEKERVREGEEDEDETARKQRIAAKLAGMGGMRLGMLPPTAGLPPASARRLATRQEDSESEDAVPPVPVPAPPQRSPPIRKPPPPIDVPVEREQGQDSRGTSDDGVQVEAEESEIEEVRYSDVDARSVSAEEEEAPLPPPRRPTNPPRSAEALPTPPPRMTSRSPPPGRPPIPIIPTSLFRRSSTAAAGSGSASSSRKTSLDDSSPGETPIAPSTNVRPPSEYVMVEADVDEEEAPAPPPRRKTTRGGPARLISLPPPPPPSAIDPPEELASSTQWELPSIPQGAEPVEDLASSGWSEDSTAVHVPPPATLSDFGSRQPSTKTAPSSSGRRSIDQQQQLSTDDLMTIWGKVGARVVEASTVLFDKSKRALVGDGSYAGFVRAVLAQVPGVLIPSGDEWGYIIYAQTGNAVQRRVSEIMPGDVIALWDAKLKGHKGLHAYCQTFGTGESGPLVGIVSEFDAKKSKVRVWQAYQHVGQQTVENVSYRLDDLKSGQVKVFRVLQA